jgi:hypothetical protein
MDETSRYLKIVAEKFFATERYIQVLDLLDVEKFLMQDTSKRRLQTYREVSDYIDEQLHAKLYGTDDRRTTMNNLINSIVVNRKQLKDLELDKNKNDDTITLYANKLMAKYSTVLESLKEYLPEERIGSRIDLLRNLGKLLMDITNIPDSEGEQFVNKKLLKELFTYLNDEEFLESNRLLMGNSIKRAQELG